mmetsp:Transcript_41168/g.118403  ORF Transcript_41168/g.118403 Transcript_41168/m.118403 type:complete len:229 (+) Transcript_41168:1271-1957(+)
MELDAPGELFCAIDSDVPLSEDVFEGTERIGEPVHGDADPSRGRLLAAARSKPWEENSGMPLSPAVAESGKSIGAECRRLRIAPANDGGMPGGFTEMAGAWPKLLWPLEDSVAKERPEDGRPTAAGSWDEGTEDAAPWRDLDAVLPSSWVCNASCNECTCSCKSFIRFTADDFQSSTRSCHSLELFTTCSRKRFISTWMSSSTSVTRSSRKTEARLRIRTSTSSSTCS